MRFFLSCQLLFRGGFEAYEWASPWFWLCSIWMNQWAGRETSPQVRSAATCGGTTRAFVNIIFVGFVQWNYSQTFILILGHVKKFMMKIYENGMRRVLILWRLATRVFLQYVQSLLAEVEHRIRRGHAPLALSQNQQSSGAAGPKGKNEEKIQVLADKIDVLLHQIEELGSEGKVEEAQGMMKLVEQLKEERELLRSTTLTTESFAAQEK